MRTFTGFRPKVPEHYVEGGYGNAPDEAQFQGVEFDDGTVAVRWLTQYRSTSLWPNFAEFTAVHGHADYETRIEWTEAASPAALDVEAISETMWLNRHLLDAGTTGASRSAYRKVAKQIAARLTEQEERT